MEVRVLKISNNKRKEQMMSGLDVLNIHKKQFESKGKVTYSTGVPINRKPEKIILTLGNILDTLYLCEIEDHKYKEKGVLFTPKEQEFIENISIEFKDEDNVSWLLVKAMKRISMDYFEDDNTKKVIRVFIKSRANNKTLDINQAL